MKILSEYKKSFSAWKEHKGIIVITIALDLFFRLFLRNFTQSNYRDLSVLSRDYFSYLKDGYASGWFTGAIIFLAIPLCCRLSLLCAFSKKIRNGKQISLKQVLKILSFSVLYFLTSYLLTLPALYLNPFSQYIQSLSTYDETAQKLYLVVVSLISTIAVQSLTCILLLFLLLTILFGSFWILTENLTLLTVFRRVKAFFGKKYKHFFHVLKPILIFILMPNAFFFGGISLITFAGTMPKISAFYIPVVALVYLGYLLTAISAVLEIISWPIIIARIAETEISFPVTIEP